MLKFHPEKIGTTGIILKKIIYTLILLVLVSSISAQLADSPWPVFHGDARGTGLSKYNTSRIDGTILWRFKTAKGIEASPVLDTDGTIYIPAHDCDLYAINPDGTKKWQFDGGDPVYSKEWETWSCSQSSPAIAKDGTIYFVTMANWLIAVNPDGTEKWRYQVHLFKNVWSSPTVASDGTIYVGSENYPPQESGKKQEIGGTLYAFNPDGTLKWKHDTGSSGVQSTAAFAADGTIITSGGCYDQSIGTFTSCIYAFNPDGSIKWKFLPDGIVEGSAVIGSDGTIYIGVKGKVNPKNGKFYALTPDGKEKWKFLLSYGMSVSPAIGKDGNIYFGDWGGIFHALGPNGKELWQVQTPISFETLSSSPAIGADGTIYFGSLAGYFYALTPDGKEKWRIDAPSGGIISSPAIGSDGTVYVGTVPGELLAVGKGSALKPATGPTQSYTKNQTDPKQAGADYYDKTCPDRIYKKAENPNYLYAVLGNKEWDLPLTRQIDWISNNCPKTIWPDGSPATPNTVNYDKDREIRFEQDAFLVSKTHIVKARFFGEIARSCLDKDCTNYEETCITWNKFKDDCYKSGKICSLPSCQKYRIYCELVVVNQDQVPVDVTFDGNYVTTDGINHFVENQNYRIEAGHGWPFVWKYDVSADNISRCDYTLYAVEETKRLTEEKAYAEKEDMPRKIICADGICDEGEADCQEDCDVRPERGKKENDHYAPNRECGNGICESGEEDYCHDDCGSAKKGFFEGIVDFFAKLFRR